MTEEQRNKRNACDRARYADLTEEQRKKRRAYKRAWHANMTEEQREKKNAHDRAYKYKRKYGITPEQYAEMLAVQHGRCAICGQLPSGKRLAVDHDHETNEVRGLLCRNHNLGLGLFDEDPAALRAAADYLEKYAKEGV